MQNKIEQTAITTTTKKKKKAEGNKEEDRKQKAKDQCALTMKYLLNSELENCDYCTVLLKSFCSTKKLNHSDICCWQPFPFTHLSCFIGNIKVKWTHAEQNDSIERLKYIIIIFCVFFSLLSLYLFLVDVCKYRRPINQSDKRITSAGQFVDIFFFSSFICVCMYPVCSSFFQSISDRSV